MHKVSAKRMSSISTISFIRLQQFLGSLSLFTLILLGRFDTSSELCKNNLLIMNNNNNCNNNNNNNINNDN